MSNKNTKLDGGNEKVHLTIIENPELLQSMNEGAAKSNSLIYWMAFFLAVESL